MYDGNLSNCHIYHIHTQRGILCCVCSELQYIVSVHVQTGHKSKLNTDEATLERYTRSLDLRPLNHRTHQCCCIGKIYQNLRILVNFDIMPQSCKQSREKTEIGRTRIQGAQAFRRLQHVMQISYPKLASSTPTFSLCSLAHFAVYTNIQKK